jgi:hypothetical protein
MSEQHDRLVKILAEQQATSLRKDNERPTPPPVQDPDVFVRQVLAHYAAHPLPAAPPVPERKYATLSESGHSTLTEAQAAAARRQLVYGASGPSLLAGAHARLIAACTR